MSTIGEQGTERCRELADQHGVEFVDAPVLGTKEPAEKGKAIVERDFEPSFALKLAAKDAGLIEESAQRHGLDLPLMTTIRRRMKQASQQHGDEDVSATYLISAP